MRRSIGMPPKRIDTRDIKQLSARHSRSGINQRTRIDIAARQYARKRRIHILERLKLFQAANIGVCRLQVRQRLLVAACLLVRLLLRNRVRLAQVRPAVR